MKIAVVHGLQRGGAARRMAGTVNALLEMPDVTAREFSLAGSTVVLPMSNAQIDWAPQAPEKSRVLKPLWRYRDAASVRLAWSELWREINGWQADVVFANPCFVPGGAPPGISESAAPVFYYCDEPRRVDYEKDAARASNPWTRLPYALMRRAQRRNERAAVFAAGRLATNSAFTAGRIMSAYGRSADVITPGIASIFSTDLDVLDVNVDRIHILSVGTLIPSKGHDLVIISAAEAGAQRPVVVVAPRDDTAERERLEGLAEGLGIELSILIGITDERLAELYRSAFVTMYLAREEPLGLASLEAQACATPVIVANDGGLVETVSDGVSGYHVARTSQSASAALVKLTGDPGLWRAFALAAARRSIPRDADSGAAVMKSLNEISRVSFASAN